MEGPRMVFSVTRTDDGLVHVQNTVMGLRGQHHVHTAEEFGRWADGAPDRGIGPVDLCDIQELRAAACDCGLAAGEMRTGR